MVSSHVDHVTNNCYEDAELAMRKVKAQYALLVGDFDAKVGRKKVGNQAAAYILGIWHMEIWHRFWNSGGELLANFMEQNNLRTINTFFCRQSWK